MATSVPVLPRANGYGAVMPTKAGYLQETRNGRPVFLGGPAIRDVSDDVKQAWSFAAARTLDALQNNGWIAGGVEAAISTIIGTGLKLNAQPDHVALGMTASQAAEWARKAENRYAARCRRPEEVDAQAQFTAGQQEAAHLRQFFGTGDAIGQFLMIPRQGVRSHTRRRLIASHRLARDTNISDRVHEGIRLDRHGAPIAYRFDLKNQHGGIDKVEYRARDRFGRPIIKHTFDGHVGQYRGITVFAPVLKRIHNMDRLTGTTLAASFLHAMFAATIESDYPTADVLQAIGAGEDENGEEVSPFTGFMGELGGWHKNVDIKLGETGKIPHLFAGEKLNLQSAKYPNANYEPLANFLLREIARCLGCLFEDLTGDYRGATYSSLQNGIAKIWPITLYRREHIAIPIKQADYEAWLEEEVDQGRIEFPGGIRGFVENRDAACKAEWQGPPKPVADELKAARADEIYYNLGTKTQGRIAADRGDDIDRVHEQLEREKESRTLRKLPEPGRRGEAAETATDNAIDDEEEKE